MRTLLIGAGALAWLPFACCAQSALDGDWKGAPTRATLPAKPWVYVIKDGVYECRSCRAKIHVPADGQDHPVTGDPYYDTLTATLVDARHFEDDRKRGGVVVWKNTYELAEDGKSMTLSDWDTTASSEPVTNKSLFTRVAKGPAGSESISGSWRQVKILESSENGNNFSFKTEGDMLSYSSPTGQSYTARLDGSEAPFKGDPGQDMVSIKRVSPRVFTETDNLGGKVIGTARITVSKDGKTLTSHWNDLTHHDSGTWVAVKQ